MGVIGTVFKKKFVIILWKMLSLNMKALVVKIPKLETKKDVKV